MLLSVLKGGKYESDLVTSRYIKNLFKDRLCFVESGSWTDSRQEREGEFLYSL